MFKLKLYFRLENILFSMIIFFGEIEINGVIIIEESLKIKHWNMVPLHGLVFRWHYLMQSIHHLNFSRYNKILGFVSTSLNTSNYLTQRPNLPPLLRRLRRLKKITFCSIQLDIVLLLIFNTFYSISKISNYAWGKTLN